MSLLIQVLSQEHGKAMSNRTGKEYDLTRILFMEIDPYTGRPKNPEVLEQNLIAELPGLLAYAKACWKQHHKDGHLEPDNTMRSLLSELVEQSPFEEYLTERCEITGDSEHSISRKVLQQDFMERYRHEHAPDFLAYVRDKDGVGYQHTKLGRTFTGIRWRHTGHVVSFQR